MNDDINRFDDMATAIIWLAGVRALAAMPDPGSMRDISWRLIDDGMAVILRVPTPFGGVSCIAEFSTAMTERDMRDGEWFGGNDDPLLHMHAEGNA
jgi:hypothetical protein